MVENDTFPIDQFWPFSLNRLTYSLEMLTVQYRIKGSFYFGPSEKAIFCEIINKNIDIEFVRLNKHTLEIDYENFFSFILYTFYTRKHQSIATPRKVDRSGALMEIWTRAM